MARIRTVHRIVANDNKLDILGIMFSARKVSLVKLNDLTIFGHVCVFFDTCQHGTGNSGRPGSGFTT